VVIFLIIIGILIANIYILAYFSHPEDSYSKGIWFYRILVVFGLSCASYLMFAIPVDLSSVDRIDSVNLGIPMHVVWKIINVVVAVALIFLLPFALIIYNDDGESFVGF